MSKHHKTLRLEADYRFEESKQWIAHSKTKYGKWIWTDGYLHGAEENQLKVPNKKDIVKAASEKYDSVTQIEAFKLGAEWAKKVYKNA